MSEILYEARIAITKVTAFGTNLSDIWQGKVPPQGLRFDVAFEGPIQGQLEGVLCGVEHLLVRADGGVSLSSRGTITIPGGRALAWNTTGVGSLREDGPFLDGSEIVTLHSTYPDMVWLNTQRILSHGITDFESNNLSVTAYL